MAIDVLREVADSLGQMQAAVMRDPASAEALVSVEQTVRSLDGFLASGEIRTILTLPPERRPPLPPIFGERVQGLFDSFHDTLSVAIQIEQLGGRADWIVPLEHALNRLECAFAELGVTVDRSWKPGPPTVHRLGTDAEGRPVLSVTTKAARQPRLKPYLALALRAVRPTEIDPGHWYAELDMFPGVWAEGRTPAECLATLEDVLHEWLIVKVVLGDSDLPILDGLDPRALVFPLPLS